ncbi:MAG: hypothetical protein LBD10_12140 [Desulfobulbus sp.]|jgi:hypothetical protein|nr:hypothetical protein [Desulfobulbus sp.]MDR2550938.1 hypothetical protein [Desulfobulbus sp.]
MEEQQQPERIAISRRQHRIVTRMIKLWQAHGIVDEQTGARLAGSIGIASFDWQRAARYAFVIAICCLVIAVGSILADRLLMELLARIFQAPPLMKCGFFAVVSAGVFWFGLFLRREYPYRTYSNEAVFFVGVLALAVAVFFLGVAFDSGTGHYAVLFLIASILYALLGLWFPSALVWVFGLLSLGAWMGTETGYVSGYGMYYLGMNYPLRFVLFGALLTGLGVVGQHASRRQGRTNLVDRLFLLSPQTKVIGLLHLFIALWIMSIFGNYGDIDHWYRARQYELLHWSLLFAAASVAAIWYGLKHDDGVMRGFGLTFLFINLYTRFFEYFWNATHKAIFFAVLAASFWYLGSRAETIWRLGQHRPQPCVDEPPQSGAGRD